MWKLMGLVALQTLFLSGGQVLLKFRLNLVGDVINLSSKSCPSFLDPSRKGPWELLENSQVT